MHGSDRGGVPDSAPGGDPTETPRKARCGPGSSWPRAVRPRCPRSSADASSPRTGSRAPGAGSGSVPGVFGTNPPCPQGSNAAVPRRRDPVGSRVCECPLVAVRTCRLLDAEARRARGGRSRGSFTAGLDGQPGCLPAGRPSATQLTSVNPPRAARRRRSPGSRTHRSSRSAGRVAAGRGGPAGPRRDVDGAGTWPSSNSVAWRTSMTSGASSARRPSRRELVDGQPAADSTGGRPRSQAGIRPARGRRPPRTRSASPARMASSQSSGSSRTSTSGRSGSTTQPSHVPNDEPDGIDSEPGTCASGRPAAGVDDERAARDAARPPRPPSGASPARRRAAAARPGSSGASGRSSAETSADRRAARGRTRRRRSADHRVVAALEADRRPRRRRDAGRAQRAGAVGRVDADEVLVREDHVVERSEHRAAYGSAFSAPSRSVRPTAPTSSDPPVNSRTGSSARDLSATA